MFAYQVWEWATSASSSALTIARFTPSVCNAKFAPVEADRHGVRVGGVAGFAEAVDVDVDERAERRHEVFDVHPRAAVDVRGVLAGEQADAHDQHRSRSAGARRAPKFIG